MTLPSSIWRDERGRMPALEVLRQMPLTRPTTTPLPDEIYDEWAPRLGAAELKALLYIVRRTLGFRKVADKISLTQFMHGIVTSDGRVLDRGCGVTSRPNVVRALKSLETKGLIRVEAARTKAGDADVTTYALWWEGDGAVETPLRGGVDTAPGGGVAREPRWFRCDPKVVSDQHQGSVAATPTTNSFPTNSQQDSETTGDSPSPHSIPCATDSDTEPAEGQMDGVALWGAVLAELRGIMTTENYVRWLDGTAVPSLEGDVLTIAVPSAHHRHWLDTRLRWQIERALRRQGYGDVCVAFEVAL